MAGEHNGQEPESTELGAGMPKRGLHLCITPCCSLIKHYQDFDTELYIIIIIS